LKWGGGKCFWIATVHLRNTLRQYWHSQELSNPLTVVLG
jgi:hypothetical protein